jgi:hypothetical protein
MAAATDRVRGYHGGMVLRRTPHALYETLYHVVWSPKYRRDVLQGEVQQRVGKLCVDIAEQYDIAMQSFTTSVSVDSAGELPLGPFRAIRGYARARGVL